MTDPVPEDTPGSPEGFAEPAGYDPGAVERKWRERWAARAANRTDIAGARRPFYALMMFPYPSAEGLHVGNLFAFTGNDIYARFQRLQGFDVFEPIGFDAFGIHSENYALKVGRAPDGADPGEHRELHATARARGAHGRLVAHGRHHAPVVLQVDAVGVPASSSSAGWRSRRRRAVNWCPNDKTVLANEQVENGRCERCGALVEQRLLEQWFFRITDYAGRLLDQPRRARLVADDHDGAARLDRAQRGRGAPVPGAEPARGRGERGRARHGRDRRRRERDPRVHDAAGHDLRRDLRGGRARASAARRDHHRRSSATRCRSTAPPRHDRTSSRARRNKEKTGVFTGLVRREPGDGRA